MLASNRHHTRARRGIVLVLVLAMLGLLALIGVTFATFSGQARINARLYAQSVLKPQDDELMDFALQQLITDTADVRSVIRGHSLARDMFGNDADKNGYLAINPATGGAPHITAMKQLSTVPLTFDVLTDIPIPANNPAMYGYDFTRWVMRVSFFGYPGNGSPQPVAQTCEILLDDYAPNGTATQFSGQGFHAFRIGPLDPAPTSQSVPAVAGRPWPGFMPNPWTVLNNPTLHYIYNNPVNTFPGWNVVGNNSNATAMALTLAFNASNFANIAFTLDGRWLHAFNGPGMGAYSVNLTVPGTNYSTPVPLSTFGNFRYNGPILQTAASQFNSTNPPPLFGPGSVGMDEDYDACDLENWFLAIQSADGQVIIPSFHRPSVIRYHDSNVNNPQLMDWDPTFRATYWNDSASRILRPVAADGHDSTAFPNLVPDKTTGKITYDVDNDGDGLTDSVWLDLGYPARRDANGLMYKPMFAFMVIGLNGRIPLNTAGNLAAQSANHAQHLGNSASEIDPTYLLQNAYGASGLTPSQALAYDSDPFNQAGNGQSPGSYNWGPTNGTYPTQNAQVDNAQDLTSGAYSPVDVRLTQLRNLLAGTRPQANPLVNPAVADSTGSVNGDDNLVFGSWPGTAGAGVAYYMPNGVADGADIAYPGNSPLVGRTTQPIAGRWGEAASVSGAPFPNPSGTPAILNLLQANYDNPVRAGYSFDVTDLLNNLSYSTTPFPRDAADDNYNAFDAYPPRINGEIFDADFFDTAGALVFPVERMRRFVTPVDINGTGQVQAWNAGGNANVGPDNYGRVRFSSYFRPAGVAGDINAVWPAAPTHPYGAITATTTGTYVRWLNTGGFQTLNSGQPYFPDMTNNPLHGYEQYKVPNTNQVAGVTAAAVTYNPTSVGGMPVLPAGGNPTAQTPPATWPTYSNSVNSASRSDGVNDADEMNLYAPNPLLDSPFGPSDLEWLYRQEDIDGTTLTSRLAKLAPISFTNTIDGQRRRRLVSLDSWEMNNYAWTTDNPAGAFANNSRFAQAANASFTGLIPNPASLAHRDKKINLNYPLPVSNDPNEPIRQKWISDVYQLFKTVLPPTSVDSVEELAQLSQFVINIIDFRDPDATMTHWVNPDVWITPSIAPTAYPTLSGASINVNSTPLDQYGMEYNPVAINEVMAYSFQSKDPGGAAASTYTNRFFIELVNTLTAAYNPTYNITNPSDPNNYYGYGTSYTGGNTPGSTVPPHQASTLDLGGFSYTTGNPYAGGCWDLVFTDDSPMSRPDPYRGDLLYNTSVTYYSLIPLNRDSMSAQAWTAGTPVTGGQNNSAPNGGDATLLPVAPTQALGANTPATLPPFTPPTTQPTAPAPPINYFYVIGSPPSTNEVNSISMTTGSPYPCVTQYLAAAFDPMSTGAGSGPPTLPSYAGVLPLLRGMNAATKPVNYSWKLNTFGNGIAAGNTAMYYWVCLRRPANPFAPVSATNPMVVVDSMRFPYMDGSPPTTDWTYDNTNKWYINKASTPNTIYSAQRLQPYRGGHAVPMPNATGAANPQGALTTTTPPDPRYGYSEQIAVPQSYNIRSAGTYGAANIGQPTPVTASTNYYYHTLGFTNDGAENWDYFAFNDRDFSSVAELMLVPGCPPGLFTKQFSEFAPSLMNAADIFATVTPNITPTSTNLPMASTSTTTPATPAATGIAPIAMFGTATVPFLSVSEATRLSTLGAGVAAGTNLPNAVPAIVPLLAQPNPPVNTVVEPHAFPYLVDRFFYTGASTFYYPPTGISLDPGSPANAAASRLPVVGGPGGDGWFKMFEFLEVPSQSNGAIGPVAQGANFDWARQDSKPGLMNLNLVIDEEAFYGIFGSQNNNGYNQTLLNSIELPLLINPNTGNAPYTMPLSTQNGGAPPIPLDGPPVPLVVSSIQPTGAPNYVYPVTDQTQSSLHGYLAVDPIFLAINAASHSGTAVQPYATGNRIKAAFAQFLWARHGGSGYIFANGTGNAGENSAVATRSLSASYTYHGRIPAERPFHSLSYPDIDYTIMRPAALSPSARGQITGGPITAPTNPAMVNADPAQNAADLYTQHAQTAGTFQFLTNNRFYSPFVGNNPNFTGAAHPNNPPVVYSGDPGVRNPFFNQGYSTSQPLVASPYAVTGANTLPAGVPIPTNVAFPGAAGTPTTASLMMPPPIPPARMFQPPDAFGAGQVQARLYRGIHNNNAGNIPPAVSSATDSGDPWINNFVANQNVNQNLATASYTLTNGFASLPWSGGQYYAGGTAALLPATGALPPISLTYPPYAAPGTAPANLVPYNGYAQVPTGANQPVSPYLGANSRTNTDDRQHPYWRTELIQKAMNLTTVRTHQYAVWITVGFFEVKRQGDIGMLLTGQPWLAYDLIGPEVGALDGRSVRYRGFFLVDRLKLTGFNPSDTGAFHNAIVYRKVIQ